MEAPILLEFTAIFTIGSLLPQPGERPCFAQIYVYDDSNEIRNRHLVANYGDIGTLEELQQLMHQINPYVSDFKTMRNDYIFITIFNFFIFVYTLYNNINCYSYFHIINFYLKFNLVIFYGLLIYYKLN